MPLPRPRDGESEGDFMQRCMGSEVMNEDFPESGQRYAVCQRQWSEGKGGSGMSRKAIVAGGVKVLDDEKGRFEAVFATLNVVDKDGDVITNGSIENGRDVRISAYNHSSWGGALPVGKGKIHERDNELVVEGEFFQSTDTGRETYETVKALGDLTEWSFGFDVTKAEPGIVEGQQVNFLQKMNVYEVSPVLLGAGVNTRTTAIKSADPQAIAAAIGNAIVALDDGRLEDTRELLEWGYASAFSITGMTVTAGMSNDKGKGAVRTHSIGVVDAEWSADENVKRLADDADEETYRNMFAWEPESDEDREDKSAWKFPHHSVGENGSPGEANFQAVASAIAALNGARGGADIPDVDRSGVYDHLAKHYRDFGEEPPELKESLGGGFKGHIVIAREAVTDVAARSRAIKEKRGRGFGKERKAELLELAGAMETAAADIREAAADGEDHTLELAAIKFALMGGWDDGN